MCLMMKLQNMNIRNLKKSEAIKAWKVVKRDDWSDGPYMKTSACQHKAKTVRVKVQLINWELAYSEGGYHSFSTENAALYFRDNHCRGENLEEFEAIPIKIWGVIAEGKQSGQRAYLSSQWMPVNRNHPIRNPKICKCKRECLTDENES